jgi:hypothetical protein
LATFASVAALALGQGAVVLGTYELKKAPAYGDNHHLLDLFIVGARSTSAKANLSADSEPIAAAAGAEQIDECSARKG